MNDDDAQLKIGIVGLGTHGTNHAEILAGLGHEVVGVDADPQTRREFQRQYDATTYESLDDLFETEIGAVAITTPNKFHEPTALKAFDAGLDVFMEKPLAHTLESAERIAAAAEESGRICMVGFHHRFRNVCNVARQYVENGYLGDIRHIDAKYIRRRGIPGRGTWYTSREIAGGGVLIDVGVHALDFLLTLYDWPSLEDVIATTRSDFGHRSDYKYIHMWGDDGEARMYDVEDSANVFCDFGDGRTAHVEVAWAANAKQMHAYDVRGTEAGASLNITNPRGAFEGSGPERNKLELYEVREAGTSHYVNSEIGVMFNDPTRTQLETFVDAVRAGERPDQCNVHQALAVQRTVEQIYDAANGV